MREEGERPARDSVYHRLRHGQADSPTGLTVARQFLRADAFSCKLLADSFKLR